ncbi:MAG: response regulator [Deltaproteobacteria bacterium]|nr:MAG: response regulator [Deltaproteobacteria bacterium]
MTARRGRSRGKARAKPKATILIIDDVPVFRELGAAFLMRTGRVITAEQAYEGLESARRERPNVVITNLLMADYEGQALCAAIKNDPELADTRVLVLVAGNSAEDHARAIRAGADEVLRTPINKIELIEAVRRLLRKPVQGAPRVSLCEPVRIVEGPQVSWGRACNLSHGGVFVESEHPLAPDTEVWLQFRLPDEDVELSTSAKVVWCSDSDAQEQRGMGLRFLAIDRVTGRRVDDFIYERAERPDQRPAKRTGS